MKTKNDSVKINMLSGSIFDKIILFAIPLAASNILQQLFNSVDVAIVGKFVGKSALAAVGANSSIISVLVNLFSGLALGTNVVIATLIGQNKKKEVSSVVHTSIVLAIISGIIMVVLGIPMAHKVLSLVGTPLNVIDQATLYLSIYLLGMPFIMLYNFGAAILRSVGDTRTPMYALVLAGVINIVLNLYLVIFVHLGVAGVAIATVASNVVSTIIVLIVLTKQDEMIKLSIKKLRVESLYLKRIIAVGAPAGIQGMVFSLSNVFVQSGINSFGDAGIAGSSTGLTFECFSYYVANSFSQAAVTFASQNYGAGDYKRCQKICRISFVEAILFTELLSAIFFIFRYPLAGLFTSDNDVIQYAVMRMMRVMALEGMTAIYEVPGGVMRGMGQSLLPAALTIFGTVGFRIIWLFTVFKWYNSFEVLMGVYPASWVFNSVMMLTAYFIVMRRRKVQMCGQ